MFEEIKQKNIHDPQWLKQQEEVLRAHMKTNPISPLPTASLWPIVAAVVILIAATLYFMSRPVPVEPVPSLSPSPITSEAPTTTPTFTPVITELPPGSTPRSTPTPIDPGNR